MLYRKREFPLSLCMPVKFFFHEKNCRLRITVNAAINLELQVDTLKRAIKTKIQKIKYLIEINMHIKNVCVCVWACVKYDLSKT